MDIETAKPTAGEMQGVRHHTLDVIAPQEPFSVGQYVAMANPILRDILARGKPCILAGGTGALYGQPHLRPDLCAALPRGTRRLQAQLEQEAHRSHFAGLWQVDPTAPGGRIRRITNGSFGLWRSFGDRRDDHPAQPADSALAPKYRPV